MSWACCALFSTPVLLEAAPMRQRSKGGVDRRILTGLDGEPRASRVLEMWRRTVAAAGVGKPSSLWCEGSACDWRTNWTARFHAAGGACQWGLRPALRRTEWAIEPGEPMGLARGRRFHSGMLGVLSSDPLPLSLSLSPSAVVTMQVLLNRPDETRCLGAAKANSTEGAAALSPANCTSVCG